MDFLGGYNSISHYRSKAQNTERQLQDDVVGNITKNRFKIQRKTLRKELVLMNTLYLAVYLRLK